MLVTCSACHTRLRIDQPPRPGQVIQCPTCQVTLAFDDPGPAKSPKKRRKQRQGISITTWIISGISVIVLLGVALFVAGLLGYGPFDFTKKARIRDYCHETHAKVNVLQVMMQENQPGLLTRIFDSDKNLEH